MTLPELMCKIWDGDENEFFTWLDMNRVEYNANILAAEVGVSTVSFIETERKSQFRFDEAQKLENLLASVAVRIGIPIRIESAWSYNRSVSFVDFERWESNFWTLYTALGGTGERIPAGKILVTYSATLFADSWSGNGPYHYDLTMPGILSSTDALVYISHTASIGQRMSEYNAILYAKIISDRHVRIVAMGAKPTENLPMNVSIGGFHLHQIISLPSTGWTGSGPWTQTVTLSSVPVNAVIGPHEGMSDDEVIAMMGAMISVSAISGTSVTIRALGTKPDIDIEPAIMWETSETE